MSSVGALILGQMFDQLESARSVLGAATLGSFRGFSRTIVTLYIIIGGYSILMGKTGERAKEIAISIVLVIILQGMILESSGYNRWVFKPVMGTALDMASFFGGTSVGNEFALFDKLDAAIASIVSTVDKLEPEGNFITNAWVYLKVAAASLVLLVVVALMYAVYLCLSGLGLFAIYILLLVGGPFIFFAAFKETRFIAGAWLKTTLQYVLWVGLLALVMATAIPGVEKAAASLAQWDVVRDGVFTKGYAVTLGFCSLVIVFLLKVSDLSSSLTGGVGMSTGAAGGMVGGVFAGGAGLAGSAAAGAAGLAGSAASSAGYAAGRGAAAIKNLGARAFSAMKGL